MKSSSKTGEGDYEHDIDHSKLLYMRATGANLRHAKWFNRIRLVYVWLASTARELLVS